MSEIYLCRTLGVKVGGGLILKGGVLASTYGLNAVSEMYV